MVQTRRLHVVCALFPGFHTLDVSLFCAPLAVAGRRWNHKAFAIALCGRDPGAVEGSPHDLHATSAFTDVEAADVVFVPGGHFDLHQFDGQEETVTALRRLVGENTKLCAVGRGQVLASRIASVGTLLGDESLQRECPSDVVLDAKQPWHSDATTYLAARSLAAWDIALQLVEDTLGKSEAQFVAAEYGRSHRKVTVSIRK
jgi:transcriptional regulator GlxA family with amidase domain